MCQTDFFFIFTLFFLLGNLKGLIIVRQLYTIFRERHFYENYVMIIILTGPVHSGKTSLLKRIEGKLMESGIFVQGFLSESLWNKDQAIGYDLYNLQNKKSLPFIRKEGKAGWEKIGAYFFLPKGLAEAKEIIFNSSPLKWLFVDEIGPLELSEKGIWPALAHTFAVAPLKILCVVRRQILDEFLAKIAYPDIHIFDIGVEHTFSHILKQLTLHESS